MLNGVVDDNNYENLLNTSKLINIVVTLPMLEGVKDLMDNGELTSLPETSTRQMIEHGEALKIPFKFDKQYRTKQPEPAHIRVQHSSMCAVKHKI